MSRTLTLGQNLAYGVPSFASAYLIFFVQSYYLKFSTDVMLIAPGTVSLVFASAKVWDAVSAPLIGNWSDRARTRFGRRRPFMVGALPLLLLSFAMLWAVPTELRGGTLIAWSAFALILFYTANDLYRLPYYALGPDLTSDPHERTRLFAVREASFTIGIFLAFAGIQAAMNAPDQRHGAAVVAVGTALVAVCLLLVPPLLLHERPILERARDNSLVNAMRDVLFMPAARRLLAVNFIEAAGTGAVASVGPYFGQYIVGRPDIAALPPAAYVIANIAAIPLWVRASRRYGRKETWTFAMVIAAIAFAGMWLIGRDQVGLLLVLLAVAGGASGCGGVIFSSLYADVIDHDARQSGERREGVYFSVNAVAGKIAGALSISLSGPLMAITGFVPNVEQTPLAQTGLRILFSALPCAGFVIGIWLFRRFTLDASSREPFVESTVQR